MKERFKPLLKAWARWQTRKKAVILPRWSEPLAAGRPQDSSSPGVSIRLLWLFVLKRTAGCETRWIMKHCFASDRKPGACAFAHMNPVDAAFIFPLLSRLWVTFGIKTNKNKLTVRHVYILSVTFKPLDSTYSMLNCTAFSKRPRRGLLFHRSETHCIDSDMQQPDWDTKRKQKCGRTTSTASLYPNKNCEGLKWIR